MARASILLDTYLLFLITDLSGIVYRYYLSPVDLPVLRFWSHLFKIFTFGATGDRQREPCPWLLSHITIIERMVSTERGMNPVAMTFINPQKEADLSGDRTSDTCSQILYAVD